MRNIFESFLLLFLMLGMTSCVHKTSNAYTSDTVKVDTIEGENDFPIDTAQVKPDTLSADSSSKVDSSSLVTPVISEGKKQK